MGSALTRGAGGVAAAQVLRARKVTRSRRCLYQGRLRARARVPAFKAIRNEYNVPVHVLSRAGLSTRGRTTSLSVPAGNANAGIFMRPARSSSTGAGPRVSRPALPADAQRELSVVRPRPLKRRGASAERPSGTRLLEKDAAITCNLAHEDAAILSLARELGRLAADLWFAGKLEQIPVCEEPPNAADED